MSKILFISGPCGSGKTTLADAYAKHIAEKTHKTVYLIHGDSFHQGFIEPDNKGDFFVDGLPSDIVQWEEILRFNWDCILSTAEKAIRRNVDVVIDYVIEDELPRVRQLAKGCQAELYYIVLTADEAVLEQRIRERGDTDLIERALFLKRKLESMPENRGHLFDNTHSNPAKIVARLELERYRLD